MTSAPQRYRIVQEALTNTSATPAPRAPRCCVSYTARDLALDVSDTGHGSASNGDGAGKGLIGMRERALLYGARRGRPAGQRLPRRAPGYPFDRE